MFPYCLDIAQGSLQVPFGNGMVSTGGIPISNSKFQKYMQEGTALNFKKMTGLMKLADICHSRPLL